MTSNRIDTLIATVDQLQAEVDNMDRVVVALGMTVCSLVVVVLILQHRVRCLT